MLLTTRAQAMGRLAQKIEVAEMDEEQGALFLLRRAGILAPDAPLERASRVQQAEARALVGELGGLPLALDQAGAYIEETHCSLADYLHLYQKERKALHQRRGGFVPDHPEPVATTWALSFAKVAEKNRAAADLLRLLSFLAPDDILEEMLMQGATEFGSLLGPMLSDELARNDAIAALLDYSLVRCSSTDQALSLHRLVQAVLKDDMNKRTYRRWAECTVRAINAASPSMDLVNWSQCERRLPHALACAALMKQEKMAFCEAGCLLAKTGCYLRARARYEQAESLFLQALEIDQQLYGPEHLQMATDLNNLAFLYWDQGKYQKAGPLWERVLEIRRQQLATQHPDLAEILNNLACHYQTLELYQQAEPLFLQALEIDQQKYEREHEEVVIDLGNLADLYPIRPQFSTTWRISMKHKANMGRPHPFMSALWENNICIRL